MFYVSENDDFDAKKKLELLNIIESADEKALMDLFVKNEIEAPLDLFETEEKSTEQLIGESAILCEQADWLMEGDEYLAEDMKNRLKDMLGMETDLKYKISKAAGSAKKALEKQLDSLGDKISALKSSIAKGAGEAVEKGKEMAGEAGEAVKKGAEKAVKAGGEAIEKGKEMAGEAGEKIAKGAGKAVETAKDVAGDVGEKVSGAASKAAEFAQANPGAVGGAVAAAAALTAGVMAYRKFFSRAAKACASAPDKKACMANYKIKARQAQVQALNSGKAKCAKTKDPAKCKAKIDGKIATLRAKKAGA